MENEVKWKQQGMWPVKNKFDPAFCDLCIPMTKTEYSKGYGKECPRDGLLNCSVVDPSDLDGKAGLARHYLSWTWGYKV